MRLVYGACMYFAWWLCREFKMDWEWMGGGTSRPV